MLIARFFPTIGGTEVQALRLSKQLKKIGTDVFVVTQKYDGKLKNYENIEGVDVYRLFSPGWGKLSSLFFIFSTVFFLSKRRKDYDVIFVHLASSPALAALMLKLFFKKKVLVKFGGGRESGDIEVAKRTFGGSLRLKLINRFADILIAPSKAVMEEMIKYRFNSKKIFLLPNGVDIEEFSPLSPKQKIGIRKKLKLPTESVIFTYIGRLERLKKVDVLIKTWKEIDSSAVLNIIGDGKMREELEEMADGNIKFFGWKLNASEYLMASDIFVLPSVAEGLSNSLLEAMSCGLAVIATDIEENSELIDDGKNGLLFEAKNPSELKEKINYLLKNINLLWKLGNSAREKIVKEYSIQKTAKDLLLRISQLK